MSIRYITLCSGVAAFAGLISWSFAPAHAAIHKITPPVIAEELSVDPSILGTEDPGTVVSGGSDYVEVAAARTTRARPARTKARRIKTGNRRTQPPAKVLGRRTGTQTNAPLDCSIESHPDCPPPSSSGTLKDMSVIQQGVRIKF